MVGRPLESGWLSCMVQILADDVIQRGGNADITVIESNGNATILPANPQQYMEETKQHLKQSFQGFELISEEEIRIDNKPGVRIVYRRGDEENKTYEENTTLFGVGSTFVFICEVPLSESNEYLSDFKHFVGDFRIGEIHADSGAEVTSPKESLSKALEIYNTAVTHYHHGDYEQAMCAFEKGIGMDEYSMQSVYARCMCQSQLGLSPDIPDSFKGDMEAVGPVYQASNLACHIIAEGHKAVLVDSSEHAEVEALLGSSKYLISIHDMFGQFISNAWRIENGKEIPILDFEANPNPTESDKFILSLLKKGTALELAAIPSEGLMNKI